MFIGVSLKLLVFICLIISYSNIFVYIRIFRVSLPFPHIFTKFYNKLKTREKNDLSPKAQSYKRPSAIEPLPIFPLLPLQWNVFIFPIYYANDEAKYMEK